MNNKYVVTLLSLKETIVMLAIASVF